MKKTIIVLKYILYVLLTMSDRQRFLAGENKNCYVPKINHDQWGSDVYYDLNKPNKRDYSTWKEFKQNNNW
jgi:hypothetical protein